MLKFHIRAMRVYYASTELGLTLNMKNMKLGRNHYSTPYSDS